MISVINLQLDIVDVKQLIRFHLHHRTYEWKEAYGRQKKKFFAQFHLLKLASTSVDLFFSLISISARCLSCLVPINSSKIDLFIPNLYLSSSSASVSFLYLQQQWFKINLLWFVNNSLSDLILIKSLEISHWKNLYICLIINQIASFD